MLGLLGPIWPGGGMFGGNLLGMPPGPPGGKFPGGPPGPPGPGNLPGGPPGPGLGCESNE